MQVINDELGAPWYEIYADLTPEPIAAASLVSQHRVIGSVTMTHDQSS
jgi:predicted unusual protein kinase regulating ubiquinone biosynthesis (AarF/ABC1/UbiB family)